MKKGIGAVGAIVLIVLFGVLIYVGWNFGAMWFSNKWLTGKVRDAIQTRSMEGNHAVVDEIARSAKERNLAVIPDNIIVERPHRDSLKVYLEYDYDIHMPGFDKTYHQKINVTEAVGG